jgi:hypothetical protein
MGETKEPDKTKEPDNTTTKQEKATANYGKRLQEKKAARKRVPIKKK